ncbi:hypothetical protein FSARC_14889 [Fusarium sarcochroum]|uniref:Uncharacterized protein n=1 Tax=Fusarium sarcochroum TaxID=1208366 RepID=A0A8H4WMM6_9HYPO|nr:hypothetical protein FSARC_14889 [Fusarium sarcochroum]
MDSQFDSPANSSPEVEYEDGTKIPGRPATNLIYIPTGPFSNLSEEGDFYTIPVYPSLGKMHGRVLEGLSPKLLELLEKMLGPGLCNNTGRKEWAAKSQKEKRQSESMVQDQELVHLHQMLFTVFYAKETRRMTLTIRPWRLMASHEDEISQPLAHDIHRKVVIFMPIDPFQWQNDDAAKMYGWFENAKSQHRDVEIYPSRDESYQSAYKLPDIKALDDIASDPQTPFEFQFRPKTCIGKGRCTLADDEGDQVFKGTFSSSGCHVRKGKRTDELCKDLLKCTLPGEPVKLTKTSAARDGDVAEPLPGRSWFHQEFVESLWQWGELRVFMVGNKIEYILFSSKGDHKVPPQVNVSRFRAEHHFGWIEDQQKRLAKIDELHRFCHFERESLLSKYPTLFDTMHVGVRFDVGISHIAEDCRFFINETTRWTQAAFYSKEWASHPYDELSMPLGRRFARLYGGIIPEVEAKAEGWADNAREKIEVLQEGMVKLKFNKSKCGKS